MNAPVNKNKFWGYAQTFRASPPSDKPAAFEQFVRRAAGLVAPDFPQAEVVDKLQSLADVHGLSDTHGPDAVQEILARGFSDPLVEADDDEIDRPPEFSDDALALDFAEQHEYQLRHVAVLNRWFAWNGALWQSDVTLAVFDLVRKSCRARAAVIKNADPRLAKSICSNKTVAAVERLARCDRRLAATAEQWDTDPLLLNTPGGVVDLRTGAIRSALPQDYMTKITGVVQDESCPTTRWHEFLRQATGGDEELAKFLQRMSGYALTGLTSEHALFFLYGTGANGKSTFLNALTGCLGTYHRATPIETFTASKVDRHPTELAALQGARLVTSVETEEGRRWAEAKIKSLTGGDRVAARFMRQDFFEFTPIFKLVIAGNHKPGLRSVDEAMRRRFNLVPFTTTVPPEERDATLGEHLKAEWPGILDWAIRGCLEWQANGLAPPRAVREATAAYLEGEDALAAWKDDQTHADRNAWESSRNLFSSFKSWADQSGEFAGSERKFINRLDARSEEFDLRKGRNAEGKRGFYGLRLKASTE